MGKEEKKCEFPDAFALKSIEIWAEENKINVLVFSEDNDMLNYTSEHLEIIKDFDLYLSEKIKEIEVVHKNNLDQIEDIIQINPESILNKIKLAIPRKTH